jgi:hypothetical protein
MNETGGERIMSGLDDFPNDPVEKLLRSDAGRHLPHDALRGTVFLQTVKVIRLRRRVKKAVAAASLAVCCMAGIAVVVFLSMTAFHPARPAPALAKVDTQGGIDRRNDAASLSRDEVLRREADQLLANGEMKQAMRKYELALSVAPANRLTVSPHDDTWLFASLKNARFDELKRVCCEP